MGMKAQAATSVPKAMNLLVQISRTKRTATATNVCCQYQDLERPSRQNSSKSPIMDSKYGLSSKYPKSQVAAIGGLDLIAPSHVRVWEDRPLAGQGRGA